MRCTRLTPLTLCLPALLACSGSPSPAPQEPAAPTPVTADAKNEDERPPTLVGRVLAHDGSPLAAAHIHVRPTNAPGEQVLEPDPDGQFELELPFAGAYDLIVFGLDHSFAKQVFDVRGGRVDAEVRLGTQTQEYEAEQLSVRLQYLDATGEAGETLVASAPAVAGEPERYRLSFEPPAGATVMRYQIVGGGRSLPTSAPGSQRWFYDGYGQYWSERDLDGTTTLDISLAELPPPALDTEVELRGEVSYPRVQDARELLAAPYASYQELSWEDDEEADCDAIAAMITDGQARIDAVEDDADLRAAGALFLGQMLGGAFNSGCIEHEAFTWVFEQAPAEHAAWAFLGPFVGYVFADSNEDPVRQAFRRELAAARQDPGLRAQLLMLDFEEALAAKRDADVEAIFAVLERDYKGTAGHGAASRHYQRERPLRAGQPMPEWTFNDLEGEAVSSAGMSGQPYLLEVWATWCGPCVEDMQYIHAAHEALGGEGGPVDFVSLSIDAHPDKVHAFRRDRWPMPWLNLFEPNAPDIYESWDFSAIPLMVLVDGEGQIVAAGGDLRGEQLLPTLEAFVAEQAQ